MRAFIAIELPEQIRADLGKIQDELKQAQADVKWVKPENIHLTLKFLGDIEQDLIKKIEAILNQISSKNTSFGLDLDNLGAFPKLQYPRVIWVGLSNDQRVIEIAKNLEKELIRIGLPPESRPFSSHITLGRVRSGSNRKALIERLEALNKKSSSRLKFEVLNLTLFKSTLTPQGPIYEPLLQAPFSGKS